MSEVTLFLSRLALRFDCEQEEHPLSQRELRPPEGRRDDVSGATSVCRGSAVEGHTAEYLCSA